MSDMNDAPATDAPATDAPATDAPATDAPATDADGVDVNAYTIRGTLAGDPRTGENPAFMTVHTTTPYTKRDAGSVRRV